MSCQTLMDFNSIFLNRNQWLFCNLVAQHSYVWSFHCLIDQIFQIGIHYFGILASVPTMRGQKNSIYSCKNGRITLYY